MSDDKARPNASAAEAKKDEATDEQPEKKPVLPAKWRSDGDKPAAKTWGTPVASVADPGARVVHAPLAEGIGTGKAFFFLFGFKKANRVDRQMLARELEHIDDDIEVLRRAGYTVVVDREAVREDFIATVTGEGEGAAGLVPAGLYWSAHGHADGGIECCDGALVRPGDVDPARVKDGLRLAIFGACYVGSRSRTWRTALAGRPLVVGWGQPVTIDRAVDFLQPSESTNTDLDDLIRRWLLTDDPIPVEADEGAGLPEPASDAGRLGELAGRIQKIADMLGARWRERGGHYDVSVPLDGGRSQVVQAFLIDGTEPFCESEVLFGVEAAAGDATALVDLGLLFRGQGRAGYGRIALTKGGADVARIVVQSFTPFARATDQDLAAHVYRVALRADALEQQLYGGDRT